MYAKVPCVSHKRTTQQPIFNDAPWAHIFIMILQTAVLWRDKMTNFDPDEQTNLSMILSLILENIRYKWLFLHFWLGSEGWAFFPAVRCSPRLFPRYVPRLKNHDLVIMIAISRLPFFSSVYDIYESFMPYFPFILKSIWPTIDSSYTQHADPEIQTQHSNTRTRFKHNSL